MRFVALSLLPLLALTRATLADDCHKGDVEAAQDQDLEVLRQVTCLEGSLTITKFVSSLRPLAKLARIDGDLRVVHAERLSSLAGLARLARVTGTVVIGGPKRGVPKLRDVDGLPALIEIGGDLWIGGGYIFKVGASLMSPVDAVSGLASLAKVGGTVHLFDLTGFRGLNGLVEIGGDLAISHGKFTALDGLSKLQRIGGTLRLDANSRLARIVGLSALAEIVGDVDVGCGNANPKLDEQTVRARLARVSVKGRLRFASATYHGDSTCDP